jgi:nucleotide-binding universal stress UspA family protein
VNASRKILVPVNLTAGSRGAFAVASKIAQECDGIIVLLHVVQLDIVGEEDGISRTRLVGELRREAELQLRQLIEGARTQVPTEIMVCEGHPAQAILGVANSLPADAILMCNHGYRGWRAWLHRNTARHVLRQSPCPVWLVHPGQRQMVVLEFFVPAGPLIPVPSVCVDGGDHAAAFRH